MKRDQVKGLMMISVKRIARRVELTATLLIGLVAGVAAVSARADGIPQQYLAADHQSCVAACVGQGKAPETCTTYCDCSIKAVGEQFTMQEYVLATQAMSQGHQPPKESFDKMQAISKTCKAGLQ